MSPETYHEKSRGGLLEALDQGDLVLGESLMWEILRRRGTCVLELEWDVKDQWGSALRESVHRLAGHYFSASSRGRTGPFQTLDEALHALTGEPGIPVSASLRAIRSSEWTEGEIRSRMRVPGTTGGPRVEGRPEDGPDPPAPAGTLPSASPGSVGHPYARICRTLLEHALDSGELVLDEEVMVAICGYLEPVFRISGVSHEMGFGTWDGRVTRLGSVYFKQFDDEAGEGPVDTLDEAMDEGPTADRPYGSFMVTPTLASVWCEEWSDEEIVQRMLLIEPPAQAIINGRIWYGESIERVHERLEGRR